LLAEAKVALMTFVMEMDEINDDFKSTETLRS